MRAAPSGKTRITAHQIGANPSAEGLEGGAISWAVAPFTTRRVHPNGVAAMPQHGRLLVTNTAQHQVEILTNVDDAELARRPAAWTKPEPRYRTGVLGKYARLVSSSTKVAVTDQVELSAN